MNIEQFKEEYPNISQKTKIIINCHQCKKEKNIYREKAMENILKNTNYTCASCVKINEYKIKPRSKETNEKISLSNIGKKFSQETKIKMSEARKLFYETNEGKEHKKKLSILTSEGHSKNK